MGSLPKMVELISTSPQIQGPFPPTKKVRHSQSSEILNDGEDPMFFPMMGLTNGMIEVTPSFFNYSNFPAGMQGARHNPLCVSSLTSYIPSCTHFLSENLYDSNMTLKLSGVSTDLNIGSVSLSENYSPKNLSSAHFNGAEPFGNRSCKPAKKDGGFSIQLFGQTICPERPVREDPDSSGSISDDGIRGCKVNEGLDGSVGSSLPFSYKQLRNQLDVHCQRASAVEACSQ
ncbi:Arf17p [Asimina triloba]